MNNIIETGEFFAPVSSDVVDGLVANYDADLCRLNEIASIFSPGSAHRQCVEYFIEGNKGYDRSTPSVDRVFELPGAIANLNSTYWQRALSLTDVLECMPQKRRDEWHQQIREMKTPNFTDDVVRATIMELLSSRSKFFAERVDGIFRSLSREHVTNRPEGFSKRMIIGYVFDGWSVGTTAIGNIHDLRTVVAKFMGRDEPRWNSTRCLIDAARRNYGEWMLVDGGSMRIRVYKKGTAHLEVHPDMAWRLNGVLASLYPSAIPSRFRVKPEKKHKDFQMIGRPLPFIVLELIGDSKVKDNKAILRNHANSAGYDEVVRVFATIGGVRSVADSCVFDFDYNPQSAIDEIISSGCIPDKKSHQYYPTPKDLACTVIGLAHIGDTHSCLEPSAGTGGLSDFMPVDRTQCFEISRLHCEVLASKGFAVNCIDFLSLSPIKTYDRIVMNPPFSENRWKLHLRHALNFIAKDGIIVAVLPSGADVEAAISGLSVNPTEIKKCGVFDNKFEGTSISVSVWQITF